MEDYQNLKKYWNSCFDKNSHYVVNDKFVTADIFNKIMEMKIPENGKVLDFGCGSGWALFEIALTCQFKEGVGVDQSINAIESANKTKEASKFKNLNFVCGDEMALRNYPSHFDLVVTVNTLDVIPFENVESILREIYYSMKMGGYLMISINNAFTEEELTDVLKLTKGPHGYYKDGILRSSNHSHEEFEALFKKMFTLCFYTEYKLFEEEKYDRQLFLLRKEN